MVNGVLGYLGVRVLVYAVMPIRLVNACATHRSHVMVAKTALAMTKTIPPAILGVVQVLEIHLKRH